VTLTTEVGPGAVLAERFRIHRRLGAGGTAAVFLAQDCVLCRDVAIKRLHGEGSDEDVRRFRREARLGASLSHPNLVTIFDTISGGDGVLIVMEYVRGRPLSDLIGPYGMAPGRLLEILRPVASALDYAHEHGVVHRDVKPANILIAEDRRVKLVDLGTATAGHLTQITAENEVMGTLAYIAPERLAGESVGEPAADVYSLAVVAFEALTGGKPYSARTPGELLERMESEGPDAIDCVPGLAPALRRSLSQGIDSDPERRQASASALVRDLEAGLPNRASSHAPPTPLPAESLPPATDASRPSGLLRHDEGRSRRGGWLLPALACLGALIAGGLWLGLSGSGSQSAKIAGGPPAKHQNPGGRSAGSASSRSAGSASPGSSSSTSAAPTASTSPPSTAADTTPASGAGTAAAASGTDLNAQGYSLIQQGQYAAAVPVLRRAVAAFPQRTTDINYAYALFNLGHALRMSGHPEEAIPILERRLQIPDQTATVQAELDAARAAASG
jgi:serine/threonine protein kinase